MSFTQRPVLDRNLHRSIDLQQMIILELECALQNPENLDRILQKAVLHAMECASLLHEARNEYLKESLPDFRLRVK